MLTVQFPPDLPAGKNKQAHGWFSDMAMKIKRRLIGGQALPMGRADAPDAGAYFLIRAN